MASPEVFNAQQQQQQQQQQQRVEPSPAQTLTQAEAEREVFDLAYNGYVEKALLLIEALGREAANSADLHKKELQTSAAGNSIAFAGAAAIAGSLIMGPLAPLGIGLSVLGVGTLGAATVIEKVLEKRIEQKLEPVLGEYEAACRTLQSVQENPAAFAYEYKRLSQKQPSSTAETLVARSLAPSAAAMNGARLASAAAHTSAHTSSFLGGNVLSRVSLHVFSKGGGHSAAAAAVGMGTMLASGAFVAVNGALVVKSLYDVARNHPGQFSEKLSEMAGAIRRDLGIQPQGPGCESQDEMPSEVCHVVGKSLAKPGGGERRHARQRPLSPRTARVCRARMSGSEVEQDGAVVSGHAVVDAVSAAVTTAMRRFAGDGAGERTSARIKRQSEDELLAGDGGDVDVVVCLESGGVVVGDGVSVESSLLVDVRAEGKALADASAGGGECGVVGGESGVVAGVIAESDLLVDVRSECDVQLDAAAAAASAGGGSAAAAAAAAAGGGGTGLLVDVTCDESGGVAGAGAESNLLVYDGAASELLVNVGGGEGDVVCAERCVTVGGGAQESNLLVVLGVGGEVSVDVGGDSENDDDLLLAEP